MYALLRGSIYFGFQIYGLWKSLEEVRSHMKEGDLPITLSLPNKADIPVRYVSTGRYITKILDEERELWIAIRGSLKNGFWFVGPLTKEDAEEMEVNYSKDIHGTMPLIKELA